MPRAYPHSHVCHGKVVGFSVKRFANEPTYFACFRSKKGRRLKRDTNQPRLAQAIEAARLLVEKEYAPNPPETFGVSWDEAINRLKARLATSGNRDSTVGYYLKCVRLVRTMYSTTNGPADISPVMAAAWRDTTMTTPNRRKKLPAPTTSLVCSAVSRPFGKNGLSTT